jgi:hypothetical protein
MTNGSPLLSTVGVVVIGRNEAKRLGGCLASIPRGVAGVVYVDSGSTDDSLTIAREHGTDTVELDPKLPFTAARARNAGLDRLLERGARVDKVQFIDGDCAFHPDWLGCGAGILDQRPELVAVVGRLHESYPEASIYNRLCDIEWGSTPPGEVRAFGGIVMMRVAALRAAGGWDARVIAAEDDELAIRLRRQGGKILRVSDAMAYHDAAIKYFRQWWRRSVRLGHAYAQVADMHGAGEEGRYFAHERRRTLVWGLVLPVGSLMLAPPTVGASLLGLGAYPLRAARIAARGHADGMPWKTAALWGGACVVSQFAQVLGLLTYQRNKISHRQSEIIEYKGAS